MWALSRTELKKFAQDKGIWFWSFILPILFIVGFMTVFTGGEDVNEAELIVHVIPGYTVMFAFFTMISIVITFLKDRDSGMIARMASTPLPIHHYLLGKWIPFILLVMIQIVFLFSFGVAVYGLPLGDPFALLALSLALAFITTGWGVAMAMLVKTDNMGIALTQLIAFGGAMLGGLMMPLDIMPEFIRSISRMLPQYWAHAGYQDIILRNGGLAQIWQSLLVLIGLGVAGGLAAFMAYPGFLRKSKS